MVRRYRNLYRMATPPMACLVCVLTVVLAGSAQPAGAQNSSGLGCFRGSPYCSVFWVLEVHVGASVSGGVKPQFGIDIGVMKNVSEDWAFGPVIGFEVSDYNASTARVRARRWSTENVGLDVEAGYLWTAFPESADASFRDGRGRGLVTGGRLNWDDRAFLMVRHHLYWVSETSTPEDQDGAPAARSAPVPNGARHRGVVAAGAGSDAAAVVLAGLVGVALWTCLSGPCDP